MNVISDTLLCKEVMNSATSILNGFRLDFYALRQFCTFEAFDGVLFRQMTYLLPYHSQVFTTTPSHCSYQQRIPTTAGNLLLEPVLNTHDASMTYIQRFKHLLHRFTWVNWQSSKDWLYCNQSINQSINLFVEPGTCKQTEIWHSQWNNKTYKAHKEHLHKTLSKKQNGNFKNTWENKKNRCATTWTDDFTLRI